MALPNADRAVVTESKARDYLLALGHRHGGAKAEFFMRFGFTQERWQVLADALCRHAREHPAVLTVSTEHGQKFESRGPLSCPDGRAVPIIVVWIVLRGDTIPRLVTAIPDP